MNRILLLIAASFVFFTAQADLITQEEADGIVLERMSQETQQYTLYAKEGVQQKMTISSADGEVIEVNYKFWAYYINYIDNTGKYIFIKESNGNLLEVKVSEADPDDLAGWRIVVPKEIPVTDVSSTPCKQNVLKSSELSDKVDVEFTNKGVQITHYNFGVSCDFTTVNVTHTFVNGVLRITQQAYPNQAKCICYTDVSYTIEGISQSVVNVIFINGMQVYCYNDKPQEPCHCVMDTLQGEWIWGKKYGGFFGNTTDNDFKSIVKILGQNEDASINYEVFVDDTLFYKGNFQIQEDQWNRRTANIKLPHDIWSDDKMWHVYLFNILELEYNDEIGHFNKPSKEDLTFWDGREDGYFYIYKKIRMEE